YGADGRGDSKNTLTMDVIAKDDRPKPLPSYGPPHPTPTRMPPPEASHGLPASHVLYEPSWRPAYPPPFDGVSNSEQRRHSATSQAPIPSHGYPPPPAPNRELPQIPPDAAPYGRPTSGLPAPTHSPDIHPNYRPVNG